MRIPFDLSFDAPYEQLVDVAPGIRRLLARNPGPFTFKGTSVTVVGRGQVAVIDPGPDDPAHLAALRRALGCETVSHILVTHTHRDHSPGSRALKEWSGAKTYGFGPHPTRSGEDANAAEEGGDLAFMPDVILRDGDVVGGDGFALTAIHTPGHISNHLCYALEGTGALFTGDHVMGWSTSVVAPPDGDMGDYLRSLRKLLARDDRIYWPTHGGPISDPKAFVTAYLQHRLEREAQILAALKDGVETIPAMVARLIRIGEKSHPCGGAFGARPRYSAYPSRTCVKRLPERRGTLAIRPLSFDKFVVFPARNAIDVSALNRGASDHKPKGTEAMNTTPSQPFSLPPLPYDQAALEPVISGRTMSFHYGKHHKAYVDKLNELSAGTDYATQKLEDIIKETAGATDDKKKAIFNNAGQIWNHTFFWASMSPRASEPEGDLKAALERDLGGLEKFKEEFAKAGVGQFGSGWVWLVLHNGKLAIEKTANADTPMAHGKKCLLTIDVWEHAYYLDYQNLRPAFLKAVSDKLLNWDFAAQNFSRAG